MQNATGIAVNVAEGIHAIDLGFLDQPGAIAAWLVRGMSGVALVETGPSTTLDRLERGLAEASVELDAVETIIVTHIHLDHAGAAGGMLRRCPQATLHIHPLGAPHLIDPSRLVSSASRIYGDDMERLWGEVVPAPADRVAVMEDQTAIDIGGRRLTPYFTPGHASHHAALLDEQTASLITGDVAGVRMQGTDLPVPPLPPPDIDLEAWHRSIDLMGSLAPERLLLTHFGAFDDVGRHLAALRNNLNRLMELGRSVLLAGGTDEELTARLDGWLRSELGPDADGVSGAMSAANPTFMSSLGIRRVLAKAGELT